MAQLPGVTVTAHVPVASSHASAVHVRPSEHVVSVAQTALPVHTPQPDVSPSLQRVPIRGDQALGLAVGSHHKHALLALTVIAE